MDKKEMENIIELVHEAYGDAGWYDHPFEEEAKKLLELVDQKDGAYAERNKLVAFLSHIFPSHLARHTGDPWDDDWRTIVCVHGPFGQMAWHIHYSEEYLFSHLDWKDNDWDGHTTAEKYERLLKIRRGDI